MEMVVTLIRPLSAAIDEKLGRCAKCMRLSAALTAGSLSLLVVALFAAAPTPILALVAMSSAAFTALSAAHGVAYVVRGPAPKGCSACAKKAEARRRQLRRHRMAFCAQHPWKCLQQRRHRTMAPKKAGGCRSCRQPRTQAELEEMADVLPAADEGLRAIVESSAEYKQLLPRLAAPEPTDTWRVGDRNHFVYTLAPTDAGETTTALFIARWDDDAPMTAMLVVQSVDGAEPRTIDLRSAATSGSALPTN